MTIIHNEIPNNDNIILIIGFFDGLHKGHWDIFQKAHQYKKEHPDFKISLITFTYSITSFFEKKTAQNHIFSLNERLVLFEKAGVDQCILITPSKKFLQQTASVFFQTIINSSKKVHYICSQETTIGSDRQNGSALPQQLKEMYTEQFNFDILSLKTIEGQKISSANIRKKLVEGKMLQLNNLLYYPFFIQNKVLRGNQQGRLIGFPTLNVDYSLEKIPVAYGVYYSKIILDNKTYQGLTFINNFKIQTQLNNILSETWVYQFDKEVYGNTVQIILEEFMRPPIKVNNLEEVKQLLNKDKNVFLSKL